LRTSLLILTGLLAFVGCDTKDEGDDTSTPSANDQGTPGGPGGDTDTGDTTGGPGPGPGGDTDTGTTGGPGPGGDDTGTAPPTSPQLDISAVYGVPNLDDDDGNGMEDWNQPGLEGEDDFIAFTVTGADRELLEAGESIEVSLTGDTDNIRVWVDGVLALGAGASNNTVSLSAGNVDAVFEVEFADFLTRGDFAVTHLDTTGGEVLSVSFEAIAAPLILNHHLQSAEQLWVMEADFGSFYGDNNDMIADMLAELGGSMDTIQERDYGSDVWVQDEIELGTLTASDGHRVDLVIDSIRQDSGRGLDDFPEDKLEAPNFIRRTWGSGRSTSQDSFGNMEVSPPVTVGPVDYPFGRIYWGDAGGNYTPTEDLTDFLDTQLVQAPFQLDTSWLCVGHVDEWMSFLPDESAPKGFWLIYSDTTLGIEFLESLTQSTSLGRYRSGHGYDTVGDIVDDFALRSLNEELQEDYIEPNLETLKTELGLDDGDIIRVPAYFEEVRGCGGTNVALIPGTANYQIFSEADGTHKLFLPDPFLRQNENDLSSDPFIAEFEGLLPSGPNYEYHWVDDWDIYHMGLGEVHCGTNVIRTPASNWWETARHLIGD